MASQPEGWRSWGLFCEFAPSRSSSQQTHLWGDKSTTYSDLQPLPGCSHLSPPQAAGRRSSPLIPFSRWVTSRPSLRLHEGWEEGHVPIHSTRSDCWNFLFLCATVATQLQRADTVSAQRSQADANQTEEENRTVPTVSHG